MCVCVYVCIYIYIYVYVYTYIIIIIIIIYIYIYIGSSPGSASSRATRSATCGRRHYFIGGESLGREIGSELQRRRSVSPCGSTRADREKQACNGLTCLTCLTPLV